MYLLPLQSLIVITPTHTRTVSVFCLYRMSSISSHFEVFRYQAVLAALHRHAVDKEVKLVDGATLEKVYTASFPDAQKSYSEFERETLTQTLSKIAAQHGLPAGDSQPLFSSALPAEYVYSAVLQAIALKNKGLSCVRAVGCDACKSKGEKTYTHKLVSADGDFLLKFDFRESEKEELEALRVWDPARRVTFFMDYYDFTALGGVGGIFNAGVYAVKKQDWTCLYFRASRNRQCPDRSMPEVFILKVVQNIREAYYERLYDRDFKVDLLRKLPKSVQAHTPYDIRKYSLEATEGPITDYMGELGVAPLVHQTWLAEGVFEKSKRNIIRGFFEFIVMDRMEMTLWAWANKHTRLFLDTYANIWKDWIEPKCDKMILAGFTHNDLHMANVMIKVDPNNDKIITDLRLIDFGILSQIDLPVSQKTLAFKRDIIKAQLFDYAVINGLETYAYQQFVKSALSERRRENERKEAALPQFKSTISNKFMNISRDRADEQPMANIGVIPPQTKENSVTLLLNLREPQAPLNVQPNQLLPANGGDDDDSKMPVSPLYYPDPTPIGWAPYCNTHHKRHFHHHHSHKSKVKSTSK